MKRWISLSVYWHYIIHRDQMETCLYFYFLYSRSQGLKGISPLHSLCVCLKLIPSIPIPRLWKSIQFINCDCILLLNSCCSDIQLIEFARVLLCMGCVWYLYFIFTVQCTCLFVSNLFVCVCVIINVFGCVIEYDCVSMGACFVFGCGFNVFSGFGPS